MTAMNQTDDHDDLKAFADAPVVGAPEDQQTRLRELVRAFAKAQDELEAYTAGLDERKKTVALYRDELLPKQCQAMGITKQEVDGHRLEIKPEVYGGLKALPDDAARAAALAYLEELGEGSKVKRTLVIELGSNSLEAEVQIRAGIAKVAARLGITIVVPEFSADIHASTLAAIGRDAQKNGKNIDLKRLGLTPVRRATLK